MLLHSKCKIRVKELQQEHKFREDVNILQKSVSAANNLTYIQCCF